MIESLFPEDAQEAELPQPVPSLFPAENEQLEQSFRLSAKKSTAASRVLRMQYKTGLPVEFIERNLDELERKAEQTGFNAEEFRLNNPKLAQWMATSPVHAAAAKTDLGSLSLLEELFGKVERIPGSWLPSPKRFEKPPFGSLKDFAAIPVGFEQGMKTRRMILLYGEEAFRGRATAAELEERNALKNDLIRYQQQYNTGFAQWIKDAANFTGINVPAGVESFRKGGTYGVPLGTAAGFAMGGPPGALTGGILGLQTVSGMSFVDELYRMSVGEAYADLEDAVDSEGKPIDPNIRRYAAFVVGVPNSFLEVASIFTTAKVVPGAERLLGMKTSAAAMKQLLAKPTVTAALKNLAGRYATAVGTEAFTESLEKFINVMTRETLAGNALRPNISSQDWEEILAEGAAAGRGTALLAPFGLAGKAFELKLEMAQATRNEEFMRSLGQGIAESKLQAQAPEAVRSFVERLKTDSAVKDVFIPVESWDNIFGEEAPKAAQELFGDLEQYNEAETLKSDLVIPIELYTEKLAGTKYHELLLRDSRLSLGEMTPNERDVAVQVEPEIQQQIVDDMRQIEEREAPLTAVEQDIRTKLTEAGMNKPAAERNALLWKEHIRARSERLGVNPTGLIQEQPFTDLTPTASEPFRRSLYESRMVEPAAPLELPLFGGREGRQAHTTIMLTAKRLVDNHNINGGGTIHPVRGGLLGQDAYTVGLMPERAIRFKGQELSTALAEEFVRQNWDLLHRLPDVSVGSWYNAADGYTYLDVVGTPDSLDTAIIDARDRGWLPEYGYAKPWFEKYGAELQFVAQPAPEKAVYDLKRSTEIQVPITPTPVEADLFSKASIVGEPIKATQPEAQVQPQLPGMPPLKREVKVSKHKQIVTFSQGTSETKITLRLSKTPDGKPLAIIDSMTVDWDERRWHVQENLVDAMLDWARSHNMFLGFSETLSTSAPMTYRNLMAAYENVYFKKRYELSGGIAVAELVQPKVLLQEAPLQEEVFTVQNYPPHPSDGMFRAFMPKMRVPTGFFPGPAGMIFTFTEMEHEDKLAMLGLLEEMEKAGLPRVMLDIPQQFGSAFYGASTINASFSPVERILAISRDTLKAYREGKLTDAQKRALVMQVAHELTHAVSFKPSQADAESPVAYSPLFYYDPFQIDLTLDEQTSALKDFKPKPGSDIGSVMRELLNAYSDETLPKGLREFFRYPLINIGQLIFGAKNPEFAVRNLGITSDTGLQALWQTSKMEAFAQVSALYYAYPRWMQENMPVSYSMMMELDHYLQQARTPAEAFDMVATATRANEPALRAKAVQQFFTQPAFFSQTPLTDLRALLTETDPQTFLRLSARTWLEELRHDALGPNAPQQIVADWNTIREQIGAENRSISQEAHNKFAAITEAYLMQAQAPTSQLRSLFSRYKDWLVKIYRSLTMVDTPMTSETRAVMDRLFATDAAIERAREAHRPLLSPEVMTAEEFAEYRQLNETARIEGEDELRSRAMRQLMKQKSKEWQTERRAMEKTVATEIDQQSGYRALYWLQNGKFPDGTQLAGIAPAKLSQQALEQKYNLADLPAEIWQSENGVHPDAAAEYLGFASGEELVKTLIGLPSREDAIQAETDERMAAEHGDIMLDPALLEQAAARVQAEKQAQVYVMEMRVLKRLGASRKLSTPAILKNIAQSMIAGKTVRELRPKYYEAAMLRQGDVAEAALLKRDFDTAFDAKQRQLLELYLYHEAMDQQQAIDQALKGMKGLFKSDSRLAVTRDLDFVNAARAIAATHGIGKHAEAPDVYMRTIRQYDQQIYDELQPIIELATADNRNYQDLTVEELGIVNDAITALWTQSRRSRQIKIAGKKMEINTAVDALNVRIQDFATPFRRLGYEKAVTDAMKRKSMLLGARAYLARVEHWVDYMDGGDFNGEFRRYIFQPIQDAANQYHEARKQVLEKFIQLVEPLRGNLSTDKIPAPEIGYEFAGKLELLGALQHTGNESNLQKLLRGRRDANGVRWGDYTAEGVLDTSRWDAFVDRMQREGVLTKADYDFLQGLWDLNESLKPAAQAVHKEIFGYYFSEITRKAFSTPWGMYEGGYVPAAVDPWVSRDAALRGEKEALTEQPSGFMFPAPARGFTRARVAAYAAPLSFDLSLAPQHLQKVLKFIYFKEPVTDVGRIVTNRRFSEMLSGLDPMIAETALVPWLQRTALQAVDTPSTSRFGQQVDQFFRTVRRRTAQNIMVGNVTNALQQLTGIGNSALQVKPRYLAGALWQLIHSPSETAAEINEKSLYMRNRLTSQTIEMTRAIDNILLNPTAYDKAKAFADQHGYFMQVGTQNVVDLITWSGAYEQATKEGVSEQIAIERADSAVRETQGSFSPEHISRFEASSPVVRAVFMFYSYYNTMANLLGVEFAKAMHRQGFTSKSGRMLYIYTLGLIIPAVVGEAIIRAASGELFDDDDDDGYLDNLLETFFYGQTRYLTGLVPGGSIVQAGINTFNDKWYDDRISTSPAVTALESAVRTPIDLYTVATAEDARLKRPIQDVLTLVGLVTGLPTAPLAKPLGYTTDVMQGYVEPENALDLTRGLITGKSGKP